MAFWKSFLSLYDCLVQKSSFYENKRFVCSSYRIEVQATTIPSSQLVGSIQFYLLLSPYLCFISLLYLDLYVLGDDALIS